MNSGKKPLKPTKKQVIWTTMWHIRELMRYAKKLSRQKHEFPGATTVMN